MQVSPVDGAAALPQSLVFLRLHAAARVLGLAVSLDGNSLALDLDTSAALRAPSWSSGEVTSAEDILLGRTVPGGLVCPAIFGDLHALDARRFGHIALACFILPLPARQLLAPLLHETPEKLLKLNALEPDRLFGLIREADLSGQTVLGHSPLEFMWWSIPVISPLLRAEEANLALVMEGETCYAHSLHSAYWRVANRARRLRRLIDLQAPMTIIESERRLVACGVDELLLNVDLDDPRAYNDEEDEVPVRVYDALTLFFATLGNKLVEMAERRLVNDPTATSWIAKAAQIGRGQTEGEPRLLALWRLAAEKPVTKLDDETLQELVSSTLPR